jgi:glyoxylase-like metal-dependent hydrolase (beta-lactamase superfamily II)
VGDEVKLVTHPIQKMKNFNITKINSDIYLITEPSFVEFANIFLIKQGTKCLIFDAGIGCQNLKQAVHKMGVNLIKITATHSHFDHIGGLFSFDKAEISLEKKVSEKISLNDIGLQYLEKDSFINKNDYSQVLYFFNKLPKLEFSSINSVLVCGKYNFKSINLPGHSEDSYIFYDKENKILITGDVFYDGKLFYSKKNSLQYLESLMYLKSLDVELILPGHNGYMDKQSFLHCLDGHIKELSN